MPFGRGRGERKGKREKISKIKWEKWYMQINF
jgi:hypothetical protein